jgi:hypothetical protein
MASIGEVPADKEKRETVIRYPVEIAFTLDLTQSFHYYIWLWFSNLRFLGF